MLVQAGAVETAEPVRVVRKMSGHPVEDDAEALRMAGVDERGEIGRRAKPAGRRKQPGRLIAPGAVERMLADGEEFDMGEAEIAHICGKLLGELAIGQPFIVALAAP